ncbi:hypothetical protein BKA66DRAFT_235161 [Pyrenochaeta sp. MPI-SDFR-AT-0127]|nr:hypothetical protein BKA66DRAFT_235161 [Pyrenochaeta sp. MPI-SDFR-AT-0127]
MLSYWDTVSDRLSKIRNCLNVQGVARQLALLDPFPKVFELVSEGRNLCSSVIALLKKHGEDALALLRQRHEVTMVDAGRAVASGC